MFLNTPQSAQALVLLGRQRYSHCADVWVEAGEDDASLPTFLQNAGQDGVQEGIHVEVGRQVVTPRAILKIQGISLMRFTSPRIKTFVTIHRLNERK